MTIVIYTSNLIYLAFSVFTDLKERKIYLMPGIICFAISAAAALSGNLFSSSQDFLLSFVPAGIMLLIYIIFRESIGLGDVAMILFLSVGHSIYDVMSFITISFVLCAIYSTFGLLLHKLRRSATLPLAPFMLVGYILYYFIQIGGIRR